MRVNIFMDIDYATEADTSSGTLPSVRVNLWLPTEKISNEVYRDSYTL